MKNKKVFVNKITDDIGNNQKYTEVEERCYEKEDVEDKLNKLFNTNGYIFNTKVKIITKDKVYNTKIASRVGNSLITLDNDVIYIKDINDIVF